MNDRERLRQTESQLRVMADSIAAHLSSQGDGHAEPPVIPPTGWGTNGAPPADMPDSMLPTWRALGHDPAHVRGGYSFAESVAHIRAHNGYTGSGVQPGGTAPPPPVQPPVTPPATGQSWDGADFPARILEGRSSTGRPVSITLTPKGYAPRTFPRQAIGGTLDVMVPRGVDLRVEAHFVSAAPGTQSTLKLKGLPRDNLSGVQFDNWSTWEPSYLWGHEQTPQGGHGGDVRTYTVPGWVIDGRYKGLPTRQKPRQTVQSLAIAVMDHGAPAG